MGSTRLAGYPFPEASEDPDGPLQFGNLARAVELDVITTFFSAAARDAAITAPIEGMFARVAGAVMFWTRANGWRNYWPSNPVKPTWSNLTLATGWTAQGGTWLLPSYTKDQLGFVHLRSMAINTSGATVSGTSRLLATLPAGYRPTGQQSGISWSANNDIMARVDIDTTGRIYPSSAIANGQRIMLDEFCYQGA